MNMRIGIITNEMDAEEATSAGIGHYVYYLVKGLTEIDSKNEYYLIHYRKTNEPNVLELYNANNEIIVPQIIPFKRVTWDTVKSMIFAIKIKKYGLDVLHEPSWPIGPFLFDFKLKYKKIITIYDIVPLLYPETCKKRYVFEFRYYLPKIVKNVDKIITDSESSKKDIIRLLNVPPEKIEVVYDGVDNDTFRPLKNVSRITQKYCLESPFILSVSTLEARKNLPRLIKSFYKLKKQGLSHKLVMAGKRGWKHQKIFETVNELNLEKEVIFLGYVPDDDLPELYNAADLFVCPSLYEGCPLTPLEAMSCGTPVVTSNTSSFPEVIGDAGIMVDPYDTHKWAEVIHNVLIDEELRQNLIKKGLEKTKVYTWEKAAKETLRIYREGYGRK